MKRLVKSVKFEKSGVKPEHWPIDGKREVAFLGRSNAGKSSFVNALAGGKVAKVSGSPGKTRLLNFFEVNRKFRFVDLPGYGFAARSRNEVKSWQQMIEAYLTERENLVGLILVMDIRRKWSDDEQMLQDFAISRNLPMLVILAKADKLNQKETHKALKLFKESTNLDYIPVSSTKGKGVLKAEEYLFSNWFYSQEEAEEE